MVIFHLAAKEEQEARVEEGREEEETEFAIKWPDKTVRRRRRGGGVFGRRRRRRLTDLVHLRRFGEKEEKRCQDQISLLRGATRNPSPYPHTRRRRTYARRLSAPGSPDVTEVPGS